jgi:hypothetical protein
MSYFSDLNIMIQEDIEAGILTFAGIAKKYNVTLCDVVEVFEEMMLNDEQNGVQ